MRVDLKIFLAFNFFVLIFATEKAINYNDPPYIALHNFFGLGGVQTPDDCGDKLKHITVVHDALLNRNVFVHTLHSNASFSDSDRCMKFDRQRIQTSVDGRSDKWMQGHNGMQFSYAWKFFAEKDIKLSGAFCHIHQIKLDGADAGNPSLTITMRKDIVQLDNKGKIIANCSISEFIGNWIQFREKVTYGKNGCITFSATRIRDGKVLMSHAGCGIDIDDQGSMIRPKFGFYRSLTNSQLLRNESVKLGDLCIGQGNSCHFNQFGMKVKKMLQINDE